MKLTIGLLLTMAVALGQTCGPQTVQGTWCLSCMGWADISGLIPGAPKGYMPMAFVGVKTLDGVSKASGTMIGNIAGIQMTLVFQDETYTVNSDCTGQATYTLFVKEMNIKLPQETQNLVVIPVPQSSAPFARDPKIQLLNAGSTKPGGNVLRCTMEKMSN